MPTFPGSFCGVVSACVLLSAWTSNSCGQEASKEPVSPGISKPGEVIANSIDMKLALIPSGSFTMGSPADEPGRDKKEEDQVEVTISKSFYLGVTEVTQGQWTSVMGTTPWKGKGPMREGSDYPAALSSPGIPK